MGGTVHDGLAVPGRVVLAQEPASSLGSVRISPPTRQVIVGAERHTIEPRVMQVLVVLAKARGAVVSRDELIDRCWDGRIVGDDSINHAIGKIRQLAARSGGAFAIETIPRVGYRLTANGEAAPEVDLAEPGEQDRVGASRRFVIASGVALGAIALGGSSVAILSSRRLPSPLAKTYYQRGIATRGQGFSNEYEQAVAYFRKAVEIDPNYAEAWGALAWSYRVLLATGEDANAPRLAALAKSAAARAIELDSDNADARLALLLLESNYRRWAEVEQGCRQLLAQRPRHSITEFHLAFVLGDTGRWREAIVHMQRVCDREPTWPMARFRLFEELANAGRIEEADARIDEAMRLAPRNLDFWSAKIDHLLLTGRPAEAAALVADTGTRPHDAVVVAQQTQIVRAHTSGSAEQWKATVTGLAGDAGAHALWAAGIAAMLGEPDLALALLEGGYFGRGPWAAKMDMRPPTHPLFSAALASVRRDGRFNRLLEGTGLEAFWRATNTEPDFRRFAST